jgi:hypothetical protein
MSFGSSRLLKVLEYFPPESQYSYPRPQIQNPNSLSDSPIPEVASPIPAHQIHRKEKTRRPPERSNDLQSECENLKVEGIATYSKFIMILIGISPGIISTQYLELEIVIHALFSKIWKYMHFSLTTGTKIITRVKFLNIRNSLC